jgi:hypothetical protein
VAFLHHATGILVKGATPPYEVRTHSVVLVNNGRRPAKNVRIGHNLLPDFSIAPGIQYSVNDLPGGQKEILFPVLIPKKQITIAYAYTAPVLWADVNTHFDHEDGAVKILNVLPTVQSPKWLRMSVWPPAGIGAIACVYLIVLGAAWLYSRV